MTSSIRSDFMLSPSYWMESSDWDKASVPAHICKEHGKTMACGAIKQRGWTWVGEGQFPKDSRCRKHPVCPDCLRALL